MILNCTSPIQFFPKSGMFSLQSFYMLGWFLNSEKWQTPDRRLFIFNLRHTPAVSYDSLFPYCSHSGTSTSSGSDWVVGGGGIDSESSCWSGSHTRVPYCIWIK